MGTPRKAQSKIPSPPFTLHACPSNSAQDYSARARDFNQKKAKLKQLRQKVLEKNPDEFYCK
jgi:hypothetical protein